MYEKILGVFVLAAMLAVPAMASAADPLPDGFIALSESEMNWADAKAWCEEKGGRLPLVGGSESLGKADKGTPIDGFGAVDGPWPKGLPSRGGVRYWAGTANADIPGLSFIINDLAGIVRALSVGKHDELRRVVCVPK